MTAKCLASYARVELCKRDLPKDLLKEGTILRNSLTTNATTVIGFEIAANKNDDELHLSDVC